MKIKFISIDQLLEMIENEEKIKIVDVLSPDSFKDGHIPGSINIPVDKIENLAKGSLKKTDKIVVYCASYSCHASTNAVMEFNRMGYKNVLDFKGGKKLWSDLGLELEK